MRNFKTIRVEEKDSVLNLQIFRPEANNSINDQLVDEITEVVSQVEANERIKIIVLSGTRESFCTGMDFKALCEDGTGFLSEDSSNKYYEMLKLLSQCSKVVLTKVEGKVNAGGIGLVAASDIVIADPAATFGLSEALFGLLPACVMPFLIRRIGYQKALWMTLTTQGISSARAYEIGLVDEISPDVADGTRRNLLRLTKLRTETIGDLKNYMSKLWIMNENTQLSAVSKISTLVNSEAVQSNIKNFVLNNKFPWEK